MSLVDIPLVSVICLCHNHGRFLEEALASVLSQDYPKVEIILVDDASTDGSAEWMAAFSKQHPTIPFIRIPVNVGNCRAFNQGLRRSRGKYVIDFATDDVLMPQRLSRQVEVFEKLDEHYGVIYTNAQRIDEDSQEIGLFYTSSAERQALPSGDVYKAVLERSFICPPTMMIRKSVLDALGGYDEALNYEDFDFWVRSARTYRYHYLDEVLTARREVRTSHSRQLYRQKVPSTLRVCEKAFQLNRNDAENRALTQCVRYHLRQAFLTENFELVPGYLALLRKLGSIDWLSRAFAVGARMKWRTGKYYRLYLKYRFGLEI